MPIWPCASRPCLLVSALGEHRERSPPGRKGPPRRRRFTDVYLFGEVGLFGAKRTGDGLPVPIMPGPHGAPRDVPGTSIAGETVLTPKGTLSVRGPMVTVAAYAPSPPASDSLIPQSASPDYA